MHHQPTIQLTRHGVALARLDAAPPRHRMDRDPFVSQPVLLPGDLPPLEEDETERGDEEGAAAVVVHGRLPLKRRAQSKESEAAPLQPRPDRR